MKQFKVRRLETRMEEMEEKRDFSNSGNIIVCHAFHLNVLMFKR